MQMATTGLGSVDGSGSRPELTVAELRSELTRLLQRLEAMEKKATAQDERQTCLIQRLEDLEEKVRQLEGWRIWVLQKQLYSALQARQKEATDGEQHDHELHDDDTDRCQWP
jgi:TolA-binding protein